MAISERMSTNAGLTAKAPQTGLFANVYPQLGQADTREARQTSSALRVRMA
jgi:hypothetical protein